MSYFVNKTDGSVIVVLDGTKDTTSTSLVLFGRLTTNYGDQTNENFVRLLENFSNTSSPASPISGQLWFDRNSNNIKVYTTNNTWVTVGSVIQGNVDISGNLEIGPFGFAVKDINGNVQVTNSANAGNISFFANVAGVSTRALNLNGLTGEVTVNANAISNFGLTTKIYVDSTLQAVASVTNNSLASNLVIINANLAARVNTETDLLNRINAANAQIALRDTISRVDSINSSISLAISSNVSAINAEIDTIESNVVTLQSNVVNLAAAANARVNAANAAITGANVAIADVNARLDSVNLAKDVAILSNVSVKANINSPTFSGTPTAPNASPTSNSDQIATTAFVQSQKASPILTGTPTAPNASPTSNSDQIATTAFVRNQVASGVPSGVIVLWAGTIATIPSGWALCNGSSGTPDLRDRFVIGARLDSGGVAQTQVTGATTITGGTKDTGVVSHSHTASAVVSDPGHRHVWGRGSEADDSGRGGSNAEFTFAAGSNATVIQPAVTGITVAVTNSTEGSSGTNQNLPPYYSLAYIMKL